MEQVTDREILQELADRPIGGPECEITFDRGEWKANAAAKEASDRARKIWLPAGKKPTRGPAVKEREDAIKASQTDLEDAVEQAGGERGKLRHD